MIRESHPLTLVPVATTIAPSRSPERIATMAGPGGFDSSWDLRRGLAVRADNGADADLRAWIDGFLGAQRTSGRIASPSASTAIA
jgi:hypothetical protein